MQEAIIKSVTLQKFKLLVSRLSPIASVVEDVYSIDMCLTNSRIIYVYKKIKTRLTKWTVQLCSP